MFVIVLVFVPHLLYLATQYNAPSPWTISPAVRPAFLAQQVIDSQGLLECCIASHWLPLQQQYFDKIRCCRSVSLWASRLFQQLILLGFYMWQQRNAIQHSDNNVQLHKRHCTVNEGIHSQFDMGPNDLPPEIKPMLSCCHRVLRKLLMDKEAWLTLLCQERRQYRRAMKAQVVFGLSSPPDPDQPFVGPYVPQIHPALSREKSFPPGWT
ncbi:unnamed protein product [Cylindrotheca closterium]|uniref:Uncharacterized protein n=1 Tax=Cylindrotheca closterium TaxID=2856 RepID=A0AAD2JNC2_9STRA|nr:unnamed protein product [Cylindrotheca closterium]